MISWPLFHPIPSKRTLLRHAGPLLFALAVLSSAFLFAACARAPETDGDRAAGEDGGGRFVLTIDPAEVRQAVDRVNGQYLSAILSGNSKALSECFTEHGAILLPGGRVIQGRDSIFIDARSVFQTTRVFEATGRTSELFVVDENAFELGEWVASVGRPDAASGRPDSGHYVRVWKRDDEREWKIWRDMVRSGTSSPVMSSAR